MYAFIIGKVVHTDKELCTKYLIGLIYAILSRKIHSPPLFTVYSNKSRIMHDMRVKQNICLGVDLILPLRCCPGVRGGSPTPTKGHDYEHFEDISTPYCDTEGETTKQNNASKHNNSSPSTSLNCRSSLHSRSNKMCVQTIAVTTMTILVNLTARELKSSVKLRIIKKYSLTLETSLKTILDVSAEKASNKSLKRSPVITITPASGDNVAEAPAIFARRPRTRKDNLYKNLLLKYQHEAETSPCSTRPRSHS